jgi:hypothetical protein
VTENKLENIIKDELPEDGPGVPKHVGANTRYFNVNFNMLYV